MNMECMTTARVTEFRVVYVLLSSFGMLFDENLEILQVPPDSPHFFFAPLIFAEKDYIQHTYLSTLRTRTTVHSFLALITTYMIFTFSAPVRQAGLAGMTRGSRTFHISRTADRRSRKSATDVEASDDIIYN